nr:hypothetical protein [Armatimonas sp.]
MTPAILLPFYEGLRIDSITAKEDAIVLRIATVAPSAPCPKCSRAATRVHSHYQRTLNDMP